MVFSSLSQVAQIARLQQHRFIKCATLYTIYISYKVYTAINTRDEYLNNERILKEVRRIINDPGFTPKSPEELLSRLFTTAYLGSKNSSESSRKRSANLAKRIGSKHYEV